MNIYEKLQSMRVALVDAEIQKTGFNKFSNYDYYQLDDFLPDCNRIMLDHQVTALYNLGKEEATLTLINCEKTDETIRFSMPVADLEIKGANAIQNIGGLNTYTRRYLYMTAFEIAESDSFDQQEQTGKHEDDAKTRPVDATKVNLIRKMMKDLEVNEEEVIKRYEIDKLEDMTIEIFQRIMEALRKTREQRSKKE